MTTSYITYVYYTGTYLGSLIASANFAALALRASAVLDQLTFDRAATETDVDVVDNIKMACCALAEELQTIGIGGSGGGIQSESVGSHSVSYKEGAPATLTDKERLSRVAALYLGNSDLLYKGFASGELGGIPADED